MLKGLLILGGLLLLIVIAGQIPGNKPAGQVIEVTQATHEQAILERKEKEAERERKSVDTATRTKVAEINVKEFCTVYGDTMRDKVTSGNTPYSIAMLERAINDFGCKAGFIDDVANRRISLGMSTCEVVAAWGQPNRSNRSVGSFGVHHQLVYSSAYVYLEEGIVTSWQD